MKEQFSHLVKSASFNIFSHFFAFRATRVKDWSWAWDGKIGYCDLFLLLAVTSFWPQKVGSRGEIYLARWKLMLISDQAQELFWRRALYVSFSTAGSHPGCWINRLFQSRKVPCNDLHRESESFTEKFDHVLPALRVWVLWVVFGSVVIASKTIYCVIYRECWQIYYE